MPEAPGALLGGLSAREFLREFWQKRPLLVRGAVPAVRGAPGLRALARIAARDDVDARLVERGPRGWRVTPAPIGRMPAALPGRWTLLVHDLELHLPAAERLLRRFGFLSWARLDDVMMSYATPGGGVGPHHDSYDVFLLQAAGRRRWRLARPRHWRLQRGQPLKLIAGFRPEVECILEPGDMLYLPPGWGHDGIALDPCLTWSIGARAPHAGELASAFLDYLEQHRLPAGEYRDPGRDPAQRPGRIDASMLEHATRTLARLSWTRADVAESLGRHLTSPKSHVFFSPPRGPLPRSAFRRRMLSARVRLDPRSRLLRHADRFFINGDGFTPPAGMRNALASLADQRWLEGPPLARAALADLIFSGIGVAG